MPYTPTIRVSPVPAYQPQPALDKKSGATNPSILRPAAQNPGDEGTAVTQRTVLQSRALALIDQARKPWDPTQLSHEDHVAELENRSAQFASAYGDLSGQRISLPGVRHILGLAPKLRDCAISLLNNEAEQRYKPLPLAERQEALARFYDVRGLRDLDDATRPMATRLHEVHILALLKHMSPEERAKEYENTCQPRPSPSTPFENDMVCRRLGLLFSLMTPQELQQVFKQLENMKTAAQADGVPQALKDDVIRRHGIALDYLRHSALRQPRDNKAG